MKQLIWILLVVSALVQPMGRTGVYVLFQTNKAYITRNLCEQRRVPASTCHGKCYLEKQLKKEEQRGHQVPNNQKQSIPDLACTANVFRISRPYFQSAQQQQRPFYSIKVYTPPTFSHFHPPQHMA